MTYAEFLIARYLSKGLMLDSNLLLLYLVGNIDATLVGHGRYSKLSSFRHTEILVLNDLIARFHRVATTAHVLTEVSNLAGRLEGAQKTQIFAAFAATLEVFGEETVPSYAVAQRSEFPFLGLTDSVLAAVSQEFLIVSHDAVMIDLLRLKGIEALKWVEVLGLAG